MRISIKKPFNSNLSTIEKEQKTLEQNREDFLNSTPEVNWDFAGIPEFEEIIKNIRNLEIVKQNGFDNSKSMFGSETKLLLSNNEPANVSSDINTYYYLTPGAKFKSVTVDFEPRGSGILFDMMGYNCKFMHQVELGYPIFDYVICVSWPRQATNQTKNYYVGSKWLGKCFNFETIKDDPFELRSEVYMVINQVPIGNNTFIKNGRLYFLKIDTNDNLLKHPGPLYRAGDLVREKSKDLEMYSMEDKGQFNHNSTLEDIKRTFNMLRNEKKFQTISKQVLGQTSEQTSEKGQ